MNTKSLSSQGHRLPATISFHRSLFHGLILLAVSLFPLFAHDGETNPSANSWDASRPDSHAPIHVMGDHTHNRGEWMVSYRFMRMDMDGNRAGTDSLTPEQVLQNFMVTPLDMTMDMHMLGAMYAPTDQLTLMLMAPFLDMDMAHRTRMGAQFTTSSSHIGDMSLTGLYKFFDDNRMRAHFNFGVSLPTGSIDHTDATPMAAVAQLPYPMQTGSGTYDVTPGITWLGQTDKLSWGVQLKNRIHLGENDRDYTRGDRLESFIWGALPLGQSTSVSLSLDYADWQDYDGADTALNPMMVPTARTDLRAGSRLDGGIGLNVKLPGGHRLALDFTLPVSQDLDGPQLETDLAATLGWQKSW
ncbi:Transporter [Sulfidibacter corallicola]|uniref:Transporter n=1 Tax=Sulfidibacter corallicola TaxID=2818388 RepID=A0A8A4TGH2_SULCO|nr:transporter [Sulfidibacter corallicola]QTD48743.1 hypothetical protein J3U87_24445 [Sulfidibacter corallicola]